MTAMRLRLIVFTVIQAITFAQVVPAVNPSANHKNAGKEYYQNRFCKLLLPLARMFGGTRLTACGVEMARGSSSTAGGLERRLASV